MNQENNQLIKLEQEITSNFENKLKNDSIEVSHHEQEISIFGLWTEIKTSLAINNTGINLERTIDSLIKCDYSSSYEINWKEVAKFIQQINQLNQEKARQAFQSVIATNQNSYRSIIEGIKKMNNQELIVKNLELTKLKAKITKIEEQAAQFEQEQQEIIKKARYLPSQERISLENLRFKFELLSRQANSLEEKNKLVKEHNQDLENSLEALEANLEALMEDLNTETARYNSTRAKLILAQGEIAELTTSEQGLKEINLELKNDYLTELYNSTKLAESIIKLRALTEETETELREIIANLEAELKNHEISLELKEKNLKELAKLNFQSKVKLQSLLFLDSLRTFLPNYFSQGLTTIETSIFLANVTNHSKLEQTSWFLLFFWLISSVLYSSGKIAKFAFFKAIDFGHWLKGRKQDLKALKEKELAQWKAKWNVGTDSEDLKEQLAEIKGNSKIIETKENNKKKAQSGAFDSKSSLSKKK